MRIGLVSPYLWTVPGGVNDHVANLAAELESRGHEPWILAPSEGVRTNGKKIPLPERFISGGMALPFRSNGSTAHVNVSPLMPWRMQRMLAGRDFDLLHVHEPCVPSVALSSVLVAEMPVVGTFHAAGARSLPYLMFSPVAGLMIEKLAGRIAVSEAAKTFVSRRFPGRYHVIPNGVVPEAYAGAVGGAKLPGKLLFIGRAEPRKGLLVLLQALQQLRRTDPRISLTIIGTDEAQLRALVSRGWSSLEWPLPGVVARGRVSHADKVQALSEAEMLVVPSLQGESFGVVLIEALAAGVPVVASDLVGYRSVLRDGELGVLVPPGDSEALARGMASLLRDEAGRARLVARGRKAAADFAWATVADRVIAVYEEALSAPVEVGTHRSAATTPVIRLTQPRDRVRGQTWMTQRRD